jgi:hypothetical protein
MIAVHLIQSHDFDLRSDDLDAPAYQVTFWKRSTEPANLPEEQRSYEAECWQWTDTDVKEIIAWADANVGNHRTYQIHVATGHGDTASNLILLFGDNPVPWTGPPGLEPLQVGG